MSGLVIDAHHHVWDPVRADYPWMTVAMAPIVRRFGPDDLEPSLLAAGVDGTVLVQARQDLAESRDLLAVAGATPFILGVVAWLDLTAPDVAETITSLRDQPGGDRLVGIRHQVHDEPDPRWLSRNDVRRGLEAVMSADLVYDLLIRPREFPAALSVVRDLPGLRFVIDHLGKPSIREGTMEPWASALRPFGELPNAWCKVSGLVTEADWATWRVSELVPYVDVALETFGPGRLLFGSDWPVCLLAASYEDVVNAVRASCATLGPTEQAAIFGRTASHVYGLRDPTGPSGAPQMGRTAPWPASEGPR